LAITSKPSNIKQSNFQEAYTNVFETQIYKICANIFRRYSSWRQRVAKNLSSLVWFLNVI